MEIVKLPETTCRVAELVRQEGPLEIAALGERLGLDQSVVTASAGLLAERGLVSVEEHRQVVYRLGPKGKELPDGQLPERVVLRALAQQGEPVPLRDLAGRLGLDKKLAGESLRWLQEKGWATREAGQLVLAAAGQEALTTLGPDEELIQQLQEATDWVALAPEAVKPFAKRKRFIDHRERVRRVVTATAKAADVRFEPVRQVTALTPEMLLDGSWRDAEFTPYDVTAGAKSVYPGKDHPLRRTIEQVRRVFLEMGFTEIVSPNCESSFWDFDALFQPQDHPAREMQDTFYVDRPGPSRLPDDRVVEQVRAAHEDGGSTGSVGWRYEWSPERAQRPVLRTHCTAATVRALAEDPRPPRKVFCVGPVFRRETITYKHLPVFHQVDGIVIDSEGSFSSLLGTLTAFYQKMGFQEFQFRPAFFPYTEPSLEIYVKHEGKDTWVEMGGAGIFRPEVTQPLGCNVPVLAWGLGIERLAMFRYGLEKIGELYGSDLDWLKEAPLCR
jgi:phenylalanyl-tRNA synthetase alpha chain